MNIEEFFPIGWLDKPFRRQPYPDMTYDKALSTAAYIAFNIGTKDSIGVEKALESARLRMTIAHTQFEGRSMQSVTEFNELWRGKVTTLLKALGETK